MNNPVFLMIVAIFFASLNATAVHMWPPEAAAHEVQGTLVNFHGQFVSAEELGAMSQAADHMCRANNDRGRACEKEREINKVIMSHGFKYTHGIYEPGTGK